MHPVVKNLENLESSQPLPGWMGFVVKHAGSMKLSLVNE